MKCLEHHAEMQSVLSDFPLTEHRGILSIINHISVDQNLSFRRLFEKIEAAQKRCLAASGNANERQCFPSVQRKIYTFKHFEIIKTFFQPAHFQKRSAAVIQITCHTRGYDLLSTNSNEILCPQPLCEKQIPLRTISSYALK